ncbi:MAG: YaeQ family protein [Spongiibacter sp.]|uniref:YaeQ family protein n=1 Tax=Spongiibacter thalassae TaxID=2721624 RepID=A0ABX1GEI2_9GAMM|nr:YaeQ family protein [Spongiibacter thalassae]MDX1505824.1 YaeQ family protein [Spongiibacter sp.]NKI17578.1 YaeQ family protein [Spongiibacter thalassae]
MALTASIFKAEIDISDLRRHYYQSHKLTLARHPSETDERMMLRLLAFAMFADEGLSFTRGLSNDDEPDLWQHGLNGDIELWLELGQPSDKRLRRARSLSRRIVVFSYGGRSSQQWWQEKSSELSRDPRLSVVDIDPTASQALAAMAQRGMRLQFTLEDSSIWVSSPDANIEITPTVWCGDITPPPR